MGEEGLPLLVCQLYPLPNPLPPLTPPTFCISRLPAQLLKWQLQRPREAVGALGTLVQPLTSLQPCSASHVSLGVASRVLGSGPSSPWSAGPAVWPCCRLHPPLPPRPPASLPRCLRCARPPRPGPLPRAPSCPLQSSTGPSLIALSSCPNAAYSPLLSWLPGQHSSLPFPTAFSAFFSIELNAVCHVMFSLVCCRSPLGAGQALSPELPSGVEPGPLQLAWGCGPRVVTDVPGVGVGSLRPKRDSPSRRWQQGGGQRLGPSAPEASSQLLGGFPSRAGLVRGRGGGACGDSEVPSSVCVCTHACVCVCMNGRGHGGAVCPPPCPPPSPSSCSPSPLSWRLQPCNSPALKAKINRG